MPCGLLSVCEKEWHYDYLLQQFIAVNLREMWFLYIQMQQGKYSENHFGAAWTEVYYKFNYSRYGNINENYISNGRSTDGQYVYLQTLLITH